MNAQETAPSDVPIRPAATVMLRADRPDLHVLMLRRRAGSAFVGGMSVFPGGGVDEEDGGASGAEASLANLRLGVREGGLAYWMAAIRETFEEAGLLLARSADGVLVDLSEGERAQRFASHRAEVDAGRRRLGAEDLPGSRLGEKCPDQLVMECVTPPLDTDVSPQRGSQQGQVAKQIQRLVAYELVLEAQPFRVQHPFFVEHDGVLQGAPMGETPHPEFLDLAQEAEGARSG